MLYEVMNQHGKTKQVSMSLEQRASYSITDSNGRDIYTDISTDDLIWSFTPPLLESYRIRAEARNVKKDKR